jgi:hypothetical protein
VAMNSITMGYHLTVARAPIDAVAAIGPRSLNIELCYLLVLMSTYYVGECEQRHPRRYFVPCRIYRALGIIAKSIESGIILRQGAVQTGKLLSLVALTLSSARK